MRPLGSTEPCAPYMPPWNESPPLATCELGPHQHTSAWSVPLAQQVRCNPGHRLGATTSKSAAFFKEIRFLPVAVMLEPVQLR